MRSHSELAALATRQHGIVTFRQLRALGFSKGAISRASGADRFLRIHRGVYAVGHRRLTPHGRCLAAVLACGDGALLSHGSAAWAWGLSASSPDVPEVLSSGGRRRKGIWVRRATGLLPEDRSAPNGIPATSVPRTLLDLTAGPAWKMESAIERAERTRQLDLVAIDELLRRHTTHPGRRNLRKAIEIYRDPGFTRSRAELAFLDALRRAGVPRPATNLFVAGYEIDMLWEGLGFGVEVDGWSSHGNRKSFEEDRLRHEDLKLVGIEIVRITARRIEREPAQVAQRVRALLDMRATERQSSTTLSPHTGDNVAGVG